MSVNVSLCYDVKSIIVLTSAVIVTASRWCCHTKTLASASAPALAMYGFEGWNATSCMASSHFLRWDVISWTHVLPSRFHRRIEQSWPATVNNFNTTNVWLPQQPVHACMHAWELSNSHWLLRKVEFINPEWTVLVSWNMKSDIVFPLKKLALFPNILGETLSHHWQTG